MKKSCITIFTCLTLSLSSHAQIGGNAVYSNVAHSPVSLQEGVDLSLPHYNFAFSSFLEANVMINVKANAYIAIFSLTQHGKTIEEAEAMMQTRVAIFKQLLQQNNISRVFVDPVSLVPVYETEVTEKKYSKTINEVPSGFEMKKNVHITFTGHDEINRIINIAAQAEVYDLVKVDYSIDNIDALLNQLRQEAVKILLTKKETLEKTGIHSRLVQTGERYGSVYPFERYAQYYAYKTGMNPVYAYGKKGQPQQVQYNYAEKNKTIYYEKVSDKQFDKVINPVAGEPMVQVYLTLKAQYNIYDPETEAAEKEYNNKLKELRIKEMELNLEDKKATIELKRKQAGFSSRIQPVKPSSN